MAGKTATLPASGSPSPAMAGGTGSSFGGDLPANPAPIMPIDGMTPDPGTASLFTGATPGELETMTGGTKQPAEIDPASIEDEGEELPGTGEFYDNEAEFLADLGLDGEYSDVRSALSAMQSKINNFDKQLSKANPIYDKLNKLSQKLGFTPDAVLNNIMEALDPGAGAVPSGPPFSNYERFVTEQIDPQFHDTYRSMAGALYQDIMAQIEGRYSRQYKGLESSVVNLRLEGRVDKFLSSSQNADMADRAQEIMDVLDEYPMMKDRPNGIKWAADFIRNGRDKGKEQPSVANRAKQLSAEKLKEIQRRKMASATEGPGRSPVVGKMPTDPRQMSAQQLSGVLKKFESSGRAKQLF